MSEAKEKKIRGKKGKGSERDGENLSDDR